MIFLNWFYEIRSYISSYGRYIRFRWLFPIIWALALAGMVWFYGEQLSFGTWHPFASPRVRLGAVILIGVVYLGYLITRLVQARRAESSLIDAVTEDGRADPARAAAEDVAELRARLKDALKTLRKSMGRGSIYRLPWYVLIGAPGAGKTTALVNSGLHFPLADATGPNPVQGVAGTRSCDWWFTDEAILIDTAGRYTAQNSEQSVDKAGWTGFLKMLRKHRPRQPLNGALVMLGLDDLMAAEPAERVRQGRTIRSRLRELDEAFRLRVPAYLVLTKTDRIAGFSAFFEGLDRTAREQVWGVTLPLPASGIEGRDLADQVRQSLGSLVERLNALLLDRLQGETDAARRAEVFAFPSQVALLADPLHEVMSEIAAASRFDPPPRIRGLYFASAQQDTVALDLMSRAAASDFGVALPDLEAGTPGSKSFFLARLLRDVIFGEASLVSTDPRRERRNRIIRWAGSGVIAATVLGLAGWWGFDYLRQEDRIAATEAHLSTYAPHAAAVPVKDVADRDFERIAPLLDQARDVGTPFARVEPVRFGLADQSDKVRSGTGDLNTRALNGLLLPRLILQVEADIRARGPEMADLIRVYPMLGSRAPMQPDVARPVLSALLARALPGDGKDVLRTALDSHVAALVAGPLAPIALDDRLLVQALASERSRQLYDRWTVHGGALCRGGLDDHYPFAKASLQDVTRQDFTSLFGPGGAFDSFFKAELRDKVDASRSPWRSKGADPIGAEFLDGFERAAAIRAAFFTGPGGALSVPFEVTPVSLDGTATSVVLASDGQEVSAIQGARGEGRPLALTWPGDLGVQGAGLTFQPAVADADIRKPGLWALFRVIDAGMGQTLGPDKVRVTYRSSVGTAAFDFHVNTALNPFDLASLRGFHCPKAP